MEPLKNQSIAVLGSGSWGTALVKILSENGHQVHWWMRHIEDVDYFQGHHHNRNYLSDVSLSSELVHPSTNLQEVIGSSSVIFLVIPAAFVEGVLLQTESSWWLGKRVVSGIKGIVPAPNQLVTDHLHQHFRIAHADLAILTGPCHAEEVALQKQSYLTVGATSSATAQAVAGLLAGPFVKVGTSEDLYGLEYSAILKNIVAIACGMAHALHYGDNFLAVLVSNALSEIALFIEQAAPASPGTHRRITDSGYAGDVLVTSYSQFSRNRTFGAMIGRGYSVVSAQMEMNMVAEGYYASACIARLNKACQVHMPVINTVHKVLYERVPVVSAFAELAEVMN